MPRIQAFSSVSVVDLTDVGSMNFYLTSNLPNSVIYDPNTNNGTYSPNWATSNLVITPVISYNGSSLSLSSQGLSISYKRKEGTGTSTNLTTGETVSSGVLTVSANKLASVSSGQLSYICTVTYTDPDTGVPISSEATLTYTLVTMASELKYAGIIGETTFLYDTSRTIVGSGSITLTADLTNCSVSQWQYKNSNGEFVAYPLANNVSITGSTLTVVHTEQDIWINGKTAIIKLVTDDNNIYDIIQISKIYDGAAGNATVAAILTNENHVIPVNSSGNIDPSSWATASTEIHIYEGGNDVTSQWTITKVDGTGLTGTYNSSTHVYTPSALTQDSSYAEFTCTRQGYSNIVKRYTITKQYAGTDGDDAVIYTVQPNVYAINLDESGNYTPTGITFSAYRTVGATKSVYSGRFKIYETTNGTDYGTAVYTSNSNEATKTYSPSTNTVVAIKCVLYESGGTTNQLDEQTVVVTRDGATGQDGDDGVDGISMGLGNYSDVIPCNTSGNAAAQRDITIPFYAYKGITRVAVTATVGTLPTGVAVNSNTAGTTSSDGVLVLRVSSGATFGNSSTMTGDITITLTAEGKSIAYKYTWTKNKQATNGTSAVLLQLYSEDGGNVEEGKNTTIKAVVYSGTSDVTSSATYVWKQFTSGAYAAISGETASTITITPSMVTDQMWLKCEATYSGNTYSAYYTIDDTTDDLTAYTYATIAEFKNSQGFGAIYTRVYRDGAEVDPIKSTTFSNTAPTGASNGDYYYHLDTTSKTCTLKKYNGTSWADATSSDNDTYTYSYYRIDNAGNSLDTTTAWKTGRCQFIDPTIINGRMQFICEVSDS